MFKSMVGIIIIINNGFNKKDESLLLTNELFL
jgi:hypothetical protein